MHPRDNRHPSVYVKVSDEFSTETQINPILAHLSRTGMDVDDLSAAAGISKLRLLKVVRQSEKPDPFECYMLDSAFHFPQGTLLEEYTIWSESF
jgi:hypothetical protein